MSEHQHQCAVIEWFGLQYPKLNGLLFASANGLHIAGTPAQKAMKWAKFEKSGGRKGVHDLFLMVARHGAHGLWIEMKSEDGRMSDWQKEFQADAKSQGYAAVTCYGFDMARGAIEEYLR